MTDYQFLAKKYKEQSIAGRYIDHQMLSDYLQTTALPFEVAAKSVENRPIYRIDIGEGNQKVLMWSQMHGNEATTTKGLVDFLNFLQSDDDLAKNMLQNNRLVIIPILNPDGAFEYTRVNANQVDLNRDAAMQTQPEMQCLQSVIDDFQPDFCFNLHDQRSIFAVGDAANVAAFSLLSPAFNEQRALNITRKKVMHVACEIADALQKFIPNQIGRYDDAFNINCIGDFLTQKNIPTLLIEAGHCPPDYQRENTRLMVFVSLLVGLTSITDDFAADISEKYHQIPENKKLFNDVVIKNVILDGKFCERLGYQYQEVLRDGNIQFVLCNDNFTGSEGKYGHVEIDFSQQNFADEEELLTVIYDFLSAKNMNLKMNVKNN